LVIKFGSWSTTLGLAEGFGALVALLLVFAPGNRPANRLLAALLGVSVLRLTPYVLGFAGFYDAYPWLSFAPFDLGLATGPLLYFYVRRLAGRPAARRWAWHLAPAVTDLAYSLWAFSLPLARKTLWDDQVHGPWISPVESAASILSLGAYLTAAGVTVRRYQAWLVEHVSDRDAHRQTWLRTVLIAMGLWLTVTAGFEIVDRCIARLTYYDRFPEYLSFAAIVIWLGLEGWRHAGHVYPPMRDPVASPIRERDWTLQAGLWRDRVADEGWWREPGLTLSDVARRLGVNETYVSRAFNLGLGQNFNGLINAMRVEAVKQRLAAGGVGEILTLALDCGFSSKASFNRVFRELTGLSPSAWRKAHIPDFAADPASEATREASGD
jgi:AraC-like DNA-binding protein